MAWKIINFRVCPEEYEQFRKRKDNESWRNAFLRLLGGIEEIEKGGAGIYKEKYEGAIELLRKFFDSFYIEGNLEQTLEKFSEALKKHMKEYEGFTKEICEGCGRAYFVPDDVISFSCPFCSSCFDTE